MARNTQGGRPDKGQPPAKAEAPGLSARRAAVAILGAVTLRRQMLSEVVDDPEGPLAPLPPAERARAQRLALAALRHVGLADRLLAPHLRKAPPPEAMQALRLAVAEVFVEGTPPHAAVNTAVALMRAGRRSAHLAGLVNAVLRKVVEDDAAWARLGPQKLPFWLRKPLVDAWGRPAVAAIEAAHAAPPPLDLTPKDPAMAAELAASLGAEVLPTGSLRLATPGQVSALPGYDSGAWWVQDAAAALPTRLLAPAPGARVLDMCAAPGGKTLQLAAQGARVTALDISARRLSRLSENLARCGLETEVVTADALDYAAPAPFDAVLLDAPCSATGTIRRHPDLPFVKDGADLPALVELQARLLDRALALVRPGGRVVFCTCSLLPEEGEAQLAAALARHPGLSVLPAAVPGADPAWAARQGGLRTRPDHWAATGGLDGFFMVALRTPGG